jgi:hypothetical protein
LIYEKSTSQPKEFMNRPTANYRRGPSRKTPAPDLNQGSRPAFVVLLVCSLAVVVIGIRWYSNHLAGPPPAAESTIAVQPAQVGQVVPRGTDPTPIVSDSPKPLAEKLGIRVASLKLSNDGSAVDFRYQVENAEKAAALALGRTTVYLVDEATGAKIQLFTPLPPEAGVPGARAHSAARMARQGGAFPPSPNRLAAGRINSLLLPNPGGQLKSGHKVTLVMGDVKTPNLTVE